MNTTTTEITTKVIGAVFVGNGTKQHIVEVVVAGTENRYGRERTLYSRPSVACGSAKWGRSGWSASHSVAELTDRWEIPADLDYIEASRLGGPFRKQAAAALREMAGVDACEKCLKDYDQRATWIAEQEAAA